MNAQELCEGLPVRFSVREDDSSIIEWRDGAFHLGLSKSVGNLDRHGFMWAHDVGHIIGATDEELRRPNIGLPILQPYGGDQWRPSPEDIVRQETYAVGTSLLVRPELSKKLIRVSCSLFKIPEGTIEAWMTEWNPNRVREALKQQIEKMQAWS